MAVWRLGVAVGSPVEEASESVPREVDNETMGPPVEEASESVPRDVDNEAIFIINNMQPIVDVFGFKTQNLITSCLKTLSV